MKKNTFLLILLALGTVTSNVLAQKVKPIGDTPVTTAIQNFNEYGIGYRIQSDGNVYTNGTDSVQSIIQGIGDWELDTKTSTVRKVFIDFSDPVSSIISGQNPNPPFPSAYVPMRFISKCAEYGINMRNLLINQQVRCPLAISLTYNNATYAVRMNANYSGTELVNWTCLAQTTDKCSSWQMDSSSFHDGEAKNIGQLIKVASTRRETDQLLGQFYFSFKINVTSP